MAFSGPAEDRLAIRELVTEYGDAVTRRDAEAWGACWAEDGFWSIPAIEGMERIEGRDTIVATWVEAMKGFPFQVNIQTPAETIIERTTGHGRVYTSELVTDTDGSPARWTGKYEDKYIKTNGRWLFSSRIFEVLHVGVA